MVYIKQRFISYFLKIFSYDFNNIFIILLINYIVIIFKNSTFLRTAGDCQEYNSLSYQKYLLYIFIRLFFRLEKCI